MFSLFRKYLRWRVLLPAFLFFVLVCMAYAYFYESRALRVVQYEITSPDLPPAFDGFKVLLIADIHHGCWMSYNLLPELVRLTREESPDLLLFGGDYAAWTEGSLQEVFAAMKELDAPYGKFGVLGNHDYKPSAGLALRLMEDTAGIHSLNDAGVWLEKGGDRIRIFGTEYLWNQNFPLQYPKYEMQRLAPDDFVLFLVHNPDDFTRFSPEQMKKIDLVLAGHTHGGQVTFFGLFTPISVISHHEYQTGIARTGSTDVITSNGVGTVKFPLRFFAPPQIVTVTLRRGEK